jgi:protein O-GlcNAc transferase
MNVHHFIQLARKHHLEGNFVQAEHVYRKILKKQPNNAGAYYELGNVLQDKGQLKEAMLCYKKTITFDPKFSGSYNNLGNVLRKSGRFEEAIYYYQQAIALAPNCAGSYYNLAQAIHDNGNLEEAITYYQKALQIDPTIANAYYSLGKALKELGVLEEAVACYHKALKLNPNHVYAYNNILLLMNYTSRYDSQTIFSEHRRFAKQIAEPLYPHLFHYTNDRSPSRRLKVGYVSPDFRIHSVNYFIWPVLASHTHDRLEIFCYSDVNAPDNVTERLQGYADHWRNIAGMQDHEVAELVLKDGIDILVDLAGHTGNNRMLLFARKPAPVQVSWLGYPNTTGLSTIDYRIVDPYTDPHGLTDLFCTEKLLRLPESFLCYLPDQNSPDVGPLPAVASGYTTFGSFNIFTKVTEEVLALWSDVLKNVPHSHLVLKTKSFFDKQICERVMKTFGQNGIHSGRVELLGHEEHFLSHLSLYNRIDIGLDTFPYSGTTTTCEALWMGVPVITLAGNRHASRVGVSLLSNTGLTDLIAKTRDEYVDIAVNLAADTQRLQKLRENLRPMMKKSPLTDAKRFTENLENSYRYMWEMWCQSA